MKLIIFGHEVSASFVDSNRPTMRLLNNFMIVSLLVGMLNACHGEYGPVSDDPLVDTAVTLKVTAAPSPHVDDISLRATHVVFFENSGRKSYYPLGDTLNGDPLALQANVQEQIHSVLNSIIVEHGHYDGFYLVLKTDRGVEDSIVRRNGLLYDLEIADIDLPNIVRYDKPYVLEQGGTVRIGLEINAHRGLVNAGDHYQLNTFARAVDLDNVGEVSGVIAQSSINRHCASAASGAIYIFPGDVVPDDYGSTGAQALTSRVATLNSDSVYSYRVSWLEPAQYTVAWTCDARADRNDADDDIHFLGRIVIGVNTSDALTVNF